MGTYDELPALYDIAFGWDVSAEVDWLLERMGDGTTSVLEPACGTGRMLAAFARRGVDAFGVDRSRAMLDIARRRLEQPGADACELIEADIRDFDLGRRVSGAVMPINTFGHLLTDDDAQRHLAAVARHLAPGSRYLVQFGLRSLENFELLQGSANTRWDTPHEDGTLRCSVFGRRFDAAAAVETQVMRFEIHDGERAGRVFEGEERLRVQDWTGWQRLIEASPFEQVAAYDGNRRGWPECGVGPGLVGLPLAWHELVRR